MNTCSYVGMSDAGKRNQIGALQSSLTILISSDEWVSLDLRTWSIPGKPTTRLKNFSFWIIINTYRKKAVAWSVSRRHPHTHKVWSDRWPRNPFNSSLNPDRVSKRSSTFQRRRWREATQNRAASKLIAEGSGTTTTERLSNVTFPEPPKNTRPLELEKLLSEILIVVATTQGSPEPVIPSLL